jgi:hypothetical protein
MTSAVPAAVGSVGAFWGAGPDHAEPTREHSTPVSSRTLRSLGTDSGGNTSHGVPCPLQGRVQDTPSDRTSQVICQELYCDGDLNTWGLGFLRNRKGSLDFEERTRQLRLTNDGHQGSNSKFGVIWDRDSDSGILYSLLHYNVTSSASHLRESITGKNDARITTRQNAQPTQPLPRVE